MITMARSLFFLRMCHESSAADFSRKENAVRVAERHQDVNDTETQCVVLDTGSGLDNRFPGWST